MSTTGVFSFSTRIGPSPALDGSDSFLFEDVRLSAIANHILGSPATDFVVDFLCMYRAIYTPSQLLDGFFLCLEKAGREDRTEKFRSFRELMCQWLLVYWKDFEEDEEEAEKRLARFLDRFERESDVEEEVKKIRVFVDTARQYSQISAGGQRDAPLPTITPKISPCPLRKIHPEEVARQITMIQWQVFSKLNLPRTIPFTGSSNSTSNAYTIPTSPSTPSISLFSLSSVQLADDLSSSSPWAPFGEWNSLCGHIQRWAATCVCTVPKPALRVKTLQHLIEVAYYLHKLGNYEGCHRILEGLKLLPLPTTWGALPPKLRSIYESLLNNIRSLFSDSSRLISPTHPHIPLIEAFAQALQVIAQTQSRFAAEPSSSEPQEPKRRWLGSSYSSNQLKYSDKSNEKGFDGLASSVPGSSSNPLLDPVYGGPTTPSAPSVTLTNTIVPGPQLNLARARAEAQLLSKLKSYQSKCFPFATVPWMADLISRASPLSIWTIQEYCEALEPTKYTTPAPTGLRSKSSPRHIGRSGGSTSYGGHHASGSGSERPTGQSSSPPIAIVDSSPPASPRSTRASPRIDSTESSPREYELSPTLGGGWIDVASSPSASSSPNSSPPNPLNTLSSTSGLGNQPQYASQTSFHHRKAIHRPASAAEMELDRLGFFVYAVPPVNDIPSSDSPRSKTPSWWALLDDDRLEDADDEITSQLLLEYLPFSAWPTLFALNPIKATFFNMRSSKLAARFKQAAKMRWRKDFCFAAHSHSKGAKLSTYRLMNTEAQQYIPVTYTVVLTNASSAPIEYEVISSSATCSAPHITKSEMFVSFSPSSGALGPGKSVTIKITAVLLETQQFYKIFCIQAFWPDLQYASFIPLYLAQARPSHAPSTLAVKELSASMASMASGNLEDAKRRLAAAKLPRSLALHAEQLRMPSTEGASFASGTVDANALAKPRDVNLFWKIPLEDLKPLKRLGGTQASVSLCSLYGADVVLKKWDIGSLDSVPDEFVAELEALRTLRHPNLVQFLGAQSAKGIAFLVTEYVPKGTLSDLLQAGELRKRHPRGASQLRHSGRPPSGSSPSTAYSTAATTSSASTSRTSTLNPHQGTNTSTASSSGQHATNRSKTSVGSLPASPDASPSVLAMSGASISGGSPPNANQPSTGDRSFPSPGTAHGPATSSMNSSPATPRQAWTPSSSSSTSTTLRLKLGIAVDVASAMAYMHYNSHMHRDLKSLNILVDEAWRGKVADLGSSKNWVNSRQMTTGVGSFDWIAPEVLTSQSYSVAADVFSFGLILWELVQEKFPDRPMDMVGKGLIPPLDPDKASLLFRDPHSAFALEYINLINRCCDINPSNRPPFTDIVVLLEQLLSNAKNAAHHASTTPRHSLRSSQATSTSTASPSGDINRGNAPTTGPRPSSPTIGASTSGHTLTSSSASLASSDSTSEIRRTTSGDAWVKAMKTNANASSSLYWHQSLSPASSPTSSAPITPADLSPTILTPHSGSPETGELHGLNPALPTFNPSPHASNTSQQDPNNSMASNNLTW
jgi:serine/threonine protein kinase